jgi:hypothetical protein
VVGIGHVTAHPVQNRMREGDGSFPFFLSDVGCGRNLMARVRGTEGCAVDR